MTAVRPPARFALVAALLAAAVPFPMAGAPAGDDIRLEIQVDQPRPAANEQIQVTYVIQGTASTDSIRIPPSLPLKNLAIVGGPTTPPSTSTMIQFINGNLTKSVSVIWALKPLGPGPAEIGETVWGVGDKTLKGHPYVLEVGPPQRQVRSTQAPPGADEDPFAVPRPFGAPFPGYRQQRQRQEPLVLYTVTPDKTTAYVGEEIVLHYELITQANISGLEYVDPPKFQGVWAEDLEKPEKPTGRRDTYENRPVTRFTLLKKGIAPLAPGTITIPPATVRLAVRAASDSLFIDPFNFMRPQLIERSTKPVAIKVLPIPGHPDFKGPVGKFDLSASLDRTKVKEGEAVTLKVRMSGTGNLRTAADPPRLEVPGARVYQPTASKGQGGKAAGRGSAQAEWSYVIVPSRPGDLVVPPIKMEVFDTAERRVVEKTTSPLSIGVEGTAAPQAGVAQGGGGEAVTIPAPEPPRKEAPVTAPEARASSSTGMASGSVDLTHGTVTVPLWALLGIPGGLLVAGGSALVIRKKLRIRGQIAEALAGERGEPKERAASRIDRALRTLLNRRFSVPETAPSASILEALETAGVPAEARTGVETLLAQIDFLRFAPQLGEYGETIEAARKQAARVFRQLG